MEAQPRIGQRREAGAGAAVAGVATGPGGVGAAALAAGVAVAVPSPWTMKVTNPEIGWPSAEVTW